MPMSQQKRNVVTSFIKLEYWIYLFVFLFIYA